MKWLSYAAGMVFLLSMSACDKTALIDELDLDKELAFSTVTVEQQKQEIEESSLEMMDVMEGIQDENALKTLVYLIQLPIMDNEVYMIQALKTQIEKPGLENMDNLSSQLRSAVTESEMWGEWVYNFETETMDQIQDLTNEIIFRFPSDSSSTTNNAEITFDYEESSIMMPDSDNYFPQEITLVMKIDGSVELNASYVGSYYDDGTPKLNTLSITMGDYLWTTELKNTDDKIIGGFEFKYEGNTILKFKVGVGSTVTIDGFENNEFDSIEAVVNSFALYLQVVDVAINGGVQHVDSLLAELRLIEAEDQQSYDDQLVVILNKYVILFAYFTDENLKIADVEFYVKEIAEEPTAMNENVYYQITPRMVLSDGSKVDVDDFVAEGFEDFVTRLENLDE